MLKRFFNRFIGRRHYWRDLGFDELSELYTSMMFRSLAWNLVGIFIPIYLYQLDYPVWQIFTFYCMSFCVHTLAVYPAAHLVAKIGPKHTILASYVFQVMSMLMFVSLGELHWPLLAIALMQGIGVCLFFTAFHTDFSKVKHSEHGGKEVGWMFSMERVGATLGPLVGGLVGFLIGPHYIFIVAILLLFIGIIPLFTTKEPIVANQKLNFRSLKVKDIKHDLISQGFFNIEASSTLIIWPLFVSIYVFKDNPYVQLGSITSISILVSIFIARAIGRTIDKRRGRSLMRLGATLNAVLHLFRPLTSGFSSALGINLMNETVTPAYRMPFLKGVYDAADGHPGNRIVYIASMELVGAIARVLLFMFAAIVAFVFQDSKNIFVVLFAVAALSSLAIMLEKFKALDP